MSFSSKLFTGVVAVSAFAFAVSAQDQPPKQKDGEANGVGKEMRHDGMGRGMRGERMGRRGPGFELRGIDLTDTQKEQIRQIREANKPSQALLDEMRTLQDARRNGTLTADQKSRLKSLRDEAKAKGSSVQSQIVSILTAEQRAQLEQRRQQMRQRMEERRLDLQQRRQERQQKRSNDTTKDTTKVT